MSILDKIDSVRNNFLAEIELIQENSAELKSFRSKYLGRKGEIASLFSQLSEVSNQERPIVGKKLNNLRNELSTYFENKVSGLSFSHR